MSVHHRPHPYGLAETSPTARPPRVRMEPSPRQLGAAAVRTLEGQEALGDSVKRMDVAVRLLSAFKRAAKRSGAPVTLEGGLTIHWMFKGGFVYSAGVTRLTEERALMWLDEELERAARKRGEA